MAISNEQITAWKEAVKAATEGPWEASEAGDVGRTGYDWGVCYPPRQGTIASLNDGEYTENPSSIADAHFIAIAREAVPALIGEVERLGSLAALVPTEGHDADGVGG